MDIKYLSPSSLATFYSSPDRYYAEKILGEPRMPQTEAMAVGSAFDCFIKCHIAEREGFSGWNLDKMLDTSIDTGLLDRSIGRGKRALLAYLDSRAWYTIKDKLADCIMEKGYNKTVGGVPLYGYPDLVYYDNGRPVVLDWKVNGYMSTRKTYAKTTHMGHGKTCVVDRDGWLYNKIPAARLYWGDQLMTYGWFLCGYGKEVGLQVHQLVCNDTIIVANHKVISDLTSQSDLLLRYQNAWKILHSDALMEEYFDLGLERVR